MTDGADIALLLADVDGTLVTHDKLLTDRARAAVRSAKAAGIAFAVTSGRPPRGMQMLFDPLDITTPIAGFNGGMIVDRTLAIQQARTLPRDLAVQIVAQMRDAGLDVWVYRGNDWLITRADAPHVARESWTVKFDPTVVDRLDDQLDEVVKIVGVSDDLALVQSTEAAMQAAIGKQATVARSQPYYLDVTHAEANKGSVLAYLARQLHIDPARIATIGDQPNDILMFTPSGYSIAMGNAGDDVKRHATQTTDDSEHEGFAKALEHLVAIHGKRQDG